MTQTEKKRGQGNRTDPETVTDRDRQTERRRDRQIEADRETGR